MATGRTQYNAAPPQYKAAPPPLSVGRVGSASPRLSAERVGSCRFTGEPAAPAPRDEEYDG